MKRLRLISTVLLGALFASAFTPFAYVYAGVQQNTENIVAIPYNQAVHMAQSGMLFSHDIDTQINNIQMLHRDLRDEISRLEAGTFNQNRINTLRDELTDLNERLSATMMSQINMGQSIEFSMQHFLDGLANIGGEGTDAFIGEALQSVMAATAAMYGTGSDIAMIQMQQMAIAEEIQRLQNETGLRNILREARNSLNELVRQIDRLHLHQKQAELAMELVLRGLIADLADLDLQIAAMEARLVLEEENQRRLALSYKLGIVSRHDFNTAENNLAQSHAQLAELMRNQNALRQNLNYLLKLPLSQPTVITFNPQLPILPQNLAGRITETTLQSPAIRLLQLDLDSAMGARRVYTNNDNDINISAGDRQRAVNNVANNNNNIAAIRNRIALQDAVERAELGLEQAVRSMEAALQRAYTDFEGLNALESTLRRELIQAEAALEVAATSFELGQVTRLDVEEAHLTILFIEQDIERVINQKWVMAFMLEHPSLLQQGN